MMHELVFSLVFVAMVIGPVFVMMRTRSEKELNHPPVSQPRS